RVSVVASDPSCGDGTTTRVRVYEGVVVVRRNGEEDQIRKGEDWPRGCAAARAPRDVESAAAIEPRAEANRAPPRGLASHVDVSNLAEQNNQFAEAMLAK